MKIAQLKEMMALAIKKVSPSGIGNKYMDPIFEVADMAQRWREASCTTQLSVDLRNSGVPDISGCVGENHEAQCPVELARQELIGALNVLEKLQ